jgi:large subunit ribosomal protein L28
MSKICQVTGKVPMVGNNRFLPNLQSHRFWVESENRFVKLRLTPKGMRIIDKKGIDVVLTDIRARGEKI